MKYSPFNRGFTMIELLVVIVIIGVLAAALTPAIGRFLTAGDDAVSRNNLMRLGRAAMTYRAENKNCYPAAGGYFASFLDGARKRRYSRARGWVYFEHSCPRSDLAKIDEVGNGDHDGYGCGVYTDEDSMENSTKVNEQGCCLCFDSNNNEGGINAQPASWYGSVSGNSYSQAHVAVMNGALFDYLSGDFKVYTNPTFNEVARQKCRIPKDKVCRAYAMNVITGTDKNVYETGRDKYMGGGTAGGDGTGACPSCGSNDNHAAIRLGKEKLQVYVDASRMEEALPSKTALFVELDLDNENVKSANDLAGDQVWDWDKGDESMGFNHENNGAFYAHVCFADGHVDAIRDPSTNPLEPDKTKRQKLSKWYGSGGLSSDGEKLD